MRIRLAIMIALIALVAAACGDDDSGATTAPTTGNTTGSTTGNTTGVTFGDGPLTNQQCLQIATAWSQAMTFGLVGVGGDVGASVEALEALSTQVPAEVADDFVLLAQGVAAYSTALEAAGIDIADPATYSSAEAQAALEAAQNNLDVSGVNEAADNISDYLDVSCGGG